MEKFSRTSKNKINKAIFLDRDGVINPPVYNPSTNEYEAPHNKEDLKLYPGALEALKALQGLDYKLFLISNQPDYAKGKIPMENLKEVHEKLNIIFNDNNINFIEYYYCYHHPQGVVPKFSLKCQCRKPGSLFLKQAELKYSLDLENSWMIGDRDVDVNCGQSVGARTILIKQQYPDGKSGKSRPDFSAENLKDAVEIIRKNTL